MNSETTLARTSQPRFLICPPRHFAVSYSINPWMDPQAWADGGAALHSAAGRQWTGLRRALRAAGAAIETLTPAPGLPDLVFTANAAVVLDRKVVLARFRYSERQDEQPVFAAAFRALQARGLIEEILELPAGITLEGAGKLLWSKAVVVSVAETPERDSGRQGRERRAQANRCRSVENGLGDVKTRG